MNKINKSVDVPQSLLHGSKVATNKIRQEIREGKSVMFGNLYRADDVKELLKEDQHGKCAYCERYLNGDYGAVEHYRPKGGYMQSCDDVLHAPGYYWLTYDWNNLLYSCDRCNTSYKRNLFPLVNDAERNIAAEDISKEKPLIINPAMEDPGDHIEFHQYMVCPKRVRGTDDIKGSTTIAIFHLNSDNELVNKRRNVWIKYKNMLELLNLACKKADKGDKEFESFAIRLRQIVDNFSSEDSEFTGMFKYQYKQKT